jgi:two-component system, NtrC family, response regulator AtoC
MGAAALCATMSAMPDASNPLRLLIADDDTNLRRVVRTELVAEGFEVTEAGSGAEAIGLLERHTYDVLLLDLNMPPPSGLEVLEWVKKEELPTEVLILTANATIPSAVEAMRLGAYDYLTKPFKFEELALVILKAEEKRTLVQENLRMKTRLKRQEEFSDIITETPSMLHLLETVRKVAVSDVPVHICGESGTGKELIAHAIHASSHRAGQAFVALNCAAITETMFESELFGHEKGAFTGAMAQKPGLLELASGGTLFIDEIGEMPQPIQVKLLRVLETGVFYRVGGVREIRVDFRIVSASNRDLVKASEEGTFRKDLYWRIGGITLKVPPLRERPDDLTPLIRHFVKRNPQFRGKTVSTSSLELLKRYAWPGNVRELFHVIHRAFLLSHRDRLDPEDFQGLEPAPAAPGSAVPAPVSRSLEDVEKNHILAVLEETDGQRGKAAEILGIDPKTLYRKLQAYGIKD